MKKTIHIPLKLVCYFELDKVKTASGDTKTLVKIASMSDEENVSPKDLAKNLPKKVLEEMEKYPEFVWFRARAIDADVSNENGDYFSEKELLKEVDIDKKGTKIPAYQTFVDCPVHTNHDNQDVEKSKGWISYAEWDDKNKCVYVIGYIDSEAYPHIARGITKGYMKDVSMGCQVEYSLCSICGNKARTEKDYCAHMRDNKGREYTGRSGKDGRSGSYVKNKLVYEENYGIKFIELSLVCDGAFEHCKIEDVYDPKDILGYASEINKTSNNIKELVAEAYTRKEIFENDELREILVACMNTNEQLRKVATNQLNKYAQGLETVSPLNNISDPVDIVNTAGTPEAPGASGSAVPGNAPAPPGVGAMTGETGTPATDTASASNILQTLNQVLGVIEGVIVQLLKLKNQINMEHVRDLAKILAELQETMGNMIDDGIGKMDFQTNIPIAQGGAGLPPFQGLQPTTGASQAPTTPQTPPPAGGGEYQSAGPVGIQMGAKSTEKRTVAAEVDLQRIKEELDCVAKNIVTYQLPDSDGNSASDGRKEYKGIMDNTEKLAQKLSEKYAQVAVEGYVREQGPFKITIASSGEVIGYYDNKRLDWEPTFTDDQIETISRGDLALAGAELLTQLREAHTHGRVITASVAAETPSEGTERRLMAKEPTWPVGRLGYPEYPIENYVGEARKGSPEEVQENQLKDQREGADNRVTEHRLEVDTAEEIGRRGNDPRVHEHRLEDERKGTDNRVHEQRLEAKRAGTSSKKEVVSAINRAVAKATIEAGISPKEAVRAIQKMASNKNLLEVLADYSTEDHKEARKVIRDRVKFFNETGVKTAGIGDSISTENYLIGNLADQVKVPEITAADISEALQLVPTLDIEQYANAISKIVKSMVEHDGIRGIPKRTADNQAELKKAFSVTLDAVNDEKGSLTKDHLKASICAITDTIREAKVSDSEVLDLLASSDKDALAEVVALEMTDEAVAQREAARERVVFFKQAGIEASENKLEEVLIGNIADNALTFKLSARSATETLVKLAAERKNAAKGLVRYAIAEIQKREAASITDRNERNVSLSFTLNEAGATDQDPDLEGKLKAFASQLLSNNGYEVSDPQSLTFTDLSLNGQSVNATIRSSTCKTTNADAAPSMGTSETVPAFVGAGNVPQFIITAGAEERKRRGREVMQRLAQAAEAAMGGSPVSPGPGSAGPGGDPAAGAMGSDPGLSAFTGGGEPGASDEDGSVSPEDSLPTPGKVQAPGKLCMMCGSTNMDVSEGHASCKDCGAEFNILLNMELTNAAELLDAAQDNVANKENEQGAEEPGTEVPGGEELGGGMPGAAAGGVSPAGPAGPAMPGAAASSNNRRTVVAENMPIAVRIVWDSEPEEFIRTAKAHADGTSKHGPLAAGHVCPECAERDRVLRATNSEGHTKVICASCGHIGNLKLTQAKNSKGDIVVRNEYTYVI